MWNLDHLLNVSNDKEGKIGGPQSDRNAKERNLEVAWVFLPKIFGYTLKELPFTIVVLIFKSYMLYI